MNSLTGSSYGDTKPASEWKLHLFVTNWTPRCIVAYRNLKKICQENIEDKYDIKVIDILEHPEVAREQQIVAIPL